MRELKRAGAKAMLYKGNTRVTLPRAAETLKPMNLVFQDGGHSLETTASDWEFAHRLLSPGGIYLFDDYYENRDDFGCRRLVETLARNPAYRVRLLDPVDYYDHTDLSVRMVRVTRWDSDPHVDTRVPGLEELRSESRTDSGPAPDPGPPAV